MSVEALNELVGKFDLSVHPVEPATELLNKQTPGIFLLRKIEDRIEQSGVGSVTIDFIPEQRPDTQQLEKVAQTLADALGDRYTIVPQAGEGFDVAPHILIVRKS